MADGFKVIGLSRTSPNNLPKEQAAFVETGLLVHHCFDLLSLTSADELIESIGLENPWLLVNNAGTYGPMEPFLGSDLDKWLTAFELNFFVISQNDFSNTQSLQKFWLYREYKWRRCH